MKAPRAMVEKMRDGRLVPVGPFDAAIVGQAKIGAIYDLVPRAKRSPPENALYWSILHAVVEATDVVPTAEHLHEQLVRGCGFVRPVLNVLTGEYEEVRDSTAFDAMEPDQFGAYMTSALAKLSEALGVDVMDLLPPKAG